MNNEIEIYKVLTCLAAFILICIVIIKAVNKTDKINKDKKWEEDNEFAEVVIKIEEPMKPKKRLIYEYDVNAKRYNFITDFPLMTYMYSCTSISGISNAEGVVNSEFDHRYQGSFQIAPLFKQPNVFINMKDYIDKYYRIDVEIINNCPDENK